MRARILFRGPSHLVVSCNEAFRTTIGDPPSGVPARELFRGPNERACFEAMDRVFNFGTDECIRHFRDDGEEGRVLMVPDRDETGAIIGVRAEWAPDRVRAPIVEALRVPLALLSALITTPTLL